MRQRYLKRRKRRSFHCGGRYRVFRGGQYDGLEIECYSTTARFRRDAVAVSGAGADGGGGGGRADAAAVLVVAAAAAGVMLSDSPLLFRW